MHRDRAVSRALRGDMTPDERKAARQEIEQRAATRERLTLRRADR